MSELELAGQTAVVTGGGAGIGRDIACAFARAGARVVSIDVDAAGNAATARMVNDIRSGAGLAVDGDVASSADMTRAFRTAGGVDILVNNAAMARGDGWLHQIDEADWDRIVDVVLKSVYLCTREALKTMLPRRRGCVINISSVNALTGIHLAAYTAAKGGVLSLTRLLAGQYGPLGVRVNAICPGTNLTESSREHYAARPEIAEELRALYPGGEFGTERDISECALYLASDRGRFINGTTLTVDGGLSAVHRLASLQTPQP